MSETSAKRRILFVDDDKNFLEGIRLMLRSHRTEWELEFAQSADEAFEMTLKQNHDAIVVDVTMPGKDGLALLQQLKSAEKTQHTPVVMLTGNSESDLKRRALAYGATDLLNKPVSEEDLVARLNSVLLLKRYQDELQVYNEELEERVSQRTAELNYSKHDILWRLAKAGEIRDEDTGDHVIRVACTSRLLAHNLGLDPTVARSIFLTSPLHDLGKIGIPDSILLKASSLTVDERAIIETHCDIGEAILLDEPKWINAFSDMEGVEQRPESFDDDLRNLAASIVMTHHEWWDGTGYPRGLSGDEIPIEGRIVAVADVYDALRSRRTYKEAFGVEQSVSIMHEECGSHFAPDVVSAFEKVVHAVEDIRAAFDS